MIAVGPPGTVANIDMSNDPLLPEAIDGNFNIVQIFPAVGSPIGQITMNDLPIALCVDTTVELNVNGMVTINASHVNGGSFDDCGSIAMTVNPNTFTTANLGPNTVTLTVTDDAGLQNTCTATVTIVPNTNPGPLAICQDVTVHLDSSGMAMVDPNEVNNGSSGSGPITLILIS